MKINKNRYSLNFKTLIFIDFQYQSINCYWLLLIIIDFIDYWLLIIIEWYHRGRIRTTCPAVYVYNKVSIKMHINTAMEKLGTKSR